jgi:hypothetical protein
MSAISTIHHDERIESFIAGLILFFGILILITRFGFSICTGISARWGIITVFIVLFIALASVVTGRSLSNVLPQLLGCEIISLS